MIILNQHLYKTLIGTKNKWILEHNIHLRSNHGITRIIINLQSSLNHSHTLLLPLTLEMTLQVIHKYIARGHIAVIIIYQ